jgi:hypothetical protein
MSSDVGVVPQGLAFRLFEGPPPAPAARVFDFRPLVQGKGMVERVKEAYAIAYTNQAAHQATSVGGDTAVARSLLRRALSLKPGFPRAMQWLGRIGP